jgi:HAD superfamily hydrolase (TIGR01509 family)
LTLLSLIIPLWWNAIITPAHAILPATTRHKDKTGKKGHFPVGYKAMNTKTPISFNRVPSLAVLEEGFPGLKALLFDMDGTLFDTEKYHAEALIQMGRDHQIRAPFSPEEIHALMIGKADYLVFELIKDWENFPREWTLQDFLDDKNRRVLEILRAAKKEAFIDPGILTLLAQARKAGHYLALVTSSEKVVTKELLQLADLANFFDLELTRDDCPRHKPDPWPYLEALRICGHDPHETLIFEDSKVGLTAALASGSHVIKVEWY